MVLPLLVDWLLYLLPLHHWTAVGLTPTYPLFVSEYL
jgi:hypothetical protein